jgi:hypothetical protein
MDEAYEPFHIRQQNSERAGQPVLYKYDDLPGEFRVQVFRILDQAISGEKQPNSITYTRVAGEDEPFGPRAIWKVISHFIADELGYTTGRPKGKDDLFSILFGSELPVPRVLSALEIAFRAVEKLPSDYKDRFGCIIDSPTAIRSLNRRFRQHDLGYSFETGMIVRVDSQYLHTQVVSPALRLLTKSGFQGAQHHFLRAHEHFKQGENDDAILDAARAFESTMQHICDELEWEYPKTAQAKDYIRIVTENGLFPSWHQNHLNSLRTLLEGLPTVRNKKASHADTEGRDAPDEMAAFGIHLAASNIVFMVESYERLRHS